MKTPEAPQTQITELEDKPGSWELQIVTSAGNKLVTTRKRLEEEYPGMSTEQIGNKIDADFEEDDKQKAESRATEDASFSAEDHYADYGQAEYDPYEEPLENPLAGDFDPQHGNHL